MVHIPCHHITAYGRCRSEHDENRHQLFGTEAERDRHRQKEDIKADELQERGSEGWTQLAEGLLKIKHRAHRHQAERGAQRSDLAAGRDQDLRLRDTEKRPEKAHQNTDDDRIRDDATGGLRERLFIESRILRIGQTECHDGHHIIKRYRTDDHKRRHAGRAIDIFDEGHPDQGGTRTVRRLYKFAALCMIMEQP